MTHQSFADTHESPIGAGAHVAHLRHLLSIVEELAHLARRGGAGYEALDQAARISAAYDRSSPLVRRRFDALADETVTWTAAAVEALLAAQEAGETPRAAAAQLARELEAALAQLARTLRA